MPQLEMFACLLCRISASLSLRSRFISQTFSLVFSSHLGLSRSIKATHAGWSDSAPRHLLALMWCSLAVSVDSVLVYQLRTSALQTSSYLMSVDLLITHTSRTLCDNVTLPQLLLWLDYFIAVSVQFVQYVQNNIIFTIHILHTSLLRWETLRSVILMDTHALTL